MVPNKNEESSLLHLMFFYVEPTLQGLLIFKLGGLDPCPPEKGEK